MNRDFIDDISIAVFFHKLNIKITKVDKAGENGFVFVSMLKDDLEYKKLVSHNYLAYRNKSENNRQYDVINMKNIIRYLTHRS